MLTSKAWLHRLVRKSSALGASVVLATSFFAVIGAAQVAYADTTTTCNPPATVPELRVPIGTGGAPATPQTVAYTCGTELLSTTAVSVEFSATPTTVPAGQTVTVSVKIPALTLKTAPTTAGTMQVDAAMTVTGGTPVTISGNKAGGALTVGSTAVPTATITQTVTAAATGATEVVIKPGILKLTVPTGTGGGTDDTIVKYTCPTAADPDNEIKVTLTVAPASVKTNEEVTITWKGEQQAGMELSAPAAGIPANSKLGVNIDGGTTVGLAPIKGEYTFTTAVAADAIVPLPATGITWKAKATTAGTAQLKPGPLTITPPTGTAISCTVANAATLKATPLTVTAGTATTTPSATATNTPRPTTTRTVTVTQTPVGGNGKVTKTPKAGAETGGGGDMGPDGRMFLLTGTAMIAAAGVVGLMMRRRTLRR